MIARHLFALAACFAPATPAHAEPCDVVLRRAESMATLRLASEERPIHVQFATQAAGVKMPTDLIEAYPETMTIILQYEFHRLKVTEDGFEVGLWFDHHYKWLAVPFDAVVGFWDMNTRMCGPE